MFDPFNPKDDPRSSEWEEEDPTDIAVPDIPGFVTDFVLHNRGREHSSGYDVWTALYAISSVIQRDVFFLDEGADINNDKEWMNLYVTLVGPAGCGKSRTVAQVQKILKGVATNMLREDSPYLKIKFPLFLADSATPEAMLHAMHSFAYTDSGERKKIIGIMNGSKMELDRNTPVIVNLTEFSSLVGKQKYAETMSSILLNLYDCPTSYDNVTIGRGQNSLAEVYFNIMAASTIQGIIDSVSPTIMQDGFMSRMIMVNVDYDEHKRIRPRRYQTICSTADLIERLTRIASTAEGAFKMDDDAIDWYDEWYRAHKKYVADNQEEAGYLSRNRSLMIKVGILLKISEYTPGNVISVKHLEAADKLVQWTYSRVGGIVSYLKDNQLAAVERIVNGMANKKEGFTRRQIAQKTKFYKREAVDSALENLMMRGVLRLINDKGENRTTAAKFTPQERYLYVRLRHKPQGFNPRKASEVSRRSKIVVSKRNPRDEDSAEDEPESMGNILSIEGGRN